MHKQFMLSKTRNYVIVKYITSNTNVSQSKVHK
jgi:hypothetical protein